ncbi:ferritin-like metal-binding protein YciE [Bradyrhizobium sp. LB7.2]
MGLFTKDIKTMNDLFVHQLQDIYYAEQQLTKALPKMADKATDPQLKQGFLTHLEETKQHVKRLEEVFKMHGAEVKAVDCPAIDGIIEEADETAGEVADKAVLDAALINAAQAAEHYEIVRYGSLIALGQAARPHGLRQRARQDAGRREGDRQEADHARREQGELARGQLGPGVAKDRASRGHPRDARMLRIHHSIVVET